LWFAKIFIFLQTTKNLNFPSPKLKMSHFQSDNPFMERQNLIELLRNSDIEFSFNPNPERYISASLTQTRLKKFIDCPSCFFKGSKKEMENKNEIMLSNTIHYLADYLIRNQDNYPNSHKVLDFINFSDGNFLEALKTDEENLNYDILKYLVDLEESAIKERILRSVLILYGTSKRLGFEEIRKRDSISVNLKNVKNKVGLTIYTKPDYTGRHKTLNTKSSRIYDNFLIDYKLNFSLDNKNNTLQMSFYFLTHLLSNRKIHNYFILDLTTGNLFKLKSINIEYLFNLLNKFLILKNLNYRGSNKNHKCEIEENILQENFLDNLDIENFGDSFGSRTYNELLIELKKLENSLEFTDLGQVVKEEEVNKILSLYPIKID
jgi:hypothetical protein